MLAAVFGQPHDRGESSNFISGFDVSNESSALRHCHGFMEKFIQLATDPDFQPFQWSWPGNHQPMHATMYVDYFLSYSLRG